MYCREALLYHLRNLEADAVDTQFDRVREAIFDDPVRNRVFTRPVDVAIDLRDWLYYGSEDSPHVSAINPDRGTDRVYKLATLCLVDPAVCFTFAWTPVNGDGTDELADPLRQLLSQTREYVESNCIYCHRGFYRVHLMQTLE